MSHQIHAPDAMGEAAHKAATASHLLQFRLLAAASALLSPEKRAQELERALVQWEPLERAMKALAAAAPITARKAQEQSDRIREIAERERG